jgi:hypothetical protein
LIIDLDADIEKSSSTNLNASLVIPLQGSAAANIGRSEKVDTEENKTQEKERKDCSESSTSLPTASDKSKSETAAMASTANSGNKATSKISIDHQVSAQH